MDGKLSKTGNGDVRSVGGILRDGMNNGKGKGQQVAVSKGTLLDKLYYKIK